jgi:hypothetical protein
VNAVCALLLLFAEEAEAVAEAVAGLWLMLMLHSAHKQLKRGEGFTCSNSHTKGQTQMGKEKEACWSCMHGRPTGSSQPHPLPLPLASSASS